MAAVSRSASVMLLGLLTATGAAFGDNRLCWDILNVAPGATPAASYAFNNPRHMGGWIYVLSQGADTRTLSIGAASPTAVRVAGGGEWQESFRYLPQGNHQITTGGSGSLASLIIRTIPEIQYSQYQSNPTVSEFGPFDWSFLTQVGVLGTVNTIISNNTTAHNTRAAEWQTSGRAWIAHAGRPTGDATTCYNYFTPN